MTPDIEILHTSGSTGRPKEIRVEHSRMLASARMTCDYLQLKPGDTALLCLSTHYIAGRMMEVRAEERRLRLIRRRPSSHPLADVEEHIDLAAMVPMQVYETLRVPIERQRFSRIRHVIIGGSAIPPDLEARLAAEFGHDPHTPNHIWSTYGMTETLSHIALRPIGEKWYQPLPGVSLSKDSDSCLIIDAPHLCPHTLHTNDIVEFNPQGGFIVRGRKDNVICTGGIKIQAEEVEALLAQHLDTPVIVTSRPHPKYGEAIVFLTTQSLDEHVLRLLLPPYSLPKQIIIVPELPLTPTGKPDRAEAREIAVLR